MIILIDLDEILADLITSVNKYYNQLHGTKFKREDYYTCNWWEVWKCSYKKADRICHEFITSPAAKKIKPMPGSVKGIKTVKQDNTLIVATVRKLEYETLTKEWLTENYGHNAFHEVHLLNKYGEGHKMIKSELAKKVGADLAIDDQIEHAVDYSTINLPCLVLNSPWNKNVDLPATATRLFSFDEIVHEIYARTQILK